MIIAGSYDVCVGGWKDGVGFEVLREDAEGLLVASGWDFTEVTEERQEVTERGWGGDPGLFPLSLSSVLSVENRWERRDRLRDSRFIKPRKDAKKARNLKGTKWHAL